MAFFTKVYNWSPKDVQAVAQNQSATANVPLVLNGTLANNGVVDFGSISRTLSLSISLGDTTATTFVVTGLRNNQIVQETITVPVPSRIKKTSNFFDSVTSIVPTSNVIGVSVGNDLNGMTRPFTPNSFITSSPVSTAIHTEVLSGDTSNSYNVIGSIQPWNNTSIDTTSVNIITSPNIIYLNQGLVNSVSGQYLTSNPAKDSSFITVTDLPLTMVAVLIKESSTSGLQLRVTITTPKLST